LRDQGQRCCAAAEAAAGAGALSFVLSLCVYALSVMCM
jgi:hypothetical protein